MLHSTPLSCSIFLSFQQCECFWFARLTMGLNKEFRAIRMQRFVCPIFDFVNIVIALFVLSLCQALVSFWPLRHWISDIFQRLHVNAFPSGVCGTVYIQMACDANVFAHSHIRISIFLSHHHDHFISSSWN